MSSHDWDALFKNRERQRYEYSPEFLDWVGMNPLREWRDEHKISLRDLRHSFDLGWGRPPSIATIHYWETGRAIPNENNFHKLARVMDRSGDSLARQWNAWLECRPDL
jgi:transcriptional regulator with XRE-family HTH domain